MFKIEILDYPDITLYFEYSDLDRYTQVLKNLLNLNPTHISSESTFRYGRPTFEVTLILTSHTYTQKYILVVVLDLFEGSDI